MFIETILRQKGRDVVTVHPDTPVAEAATLLMRKGIGLLVVLDEDHRIAGMLSERDIVRAAAENDASLTGLAVHDIMTRRVLTSAPGDDLEHVMAVMTHKRVRHLPVIENGRLAGLISIGDVMKYRLEEMQHEGDSMREYIAGAGY